MAIEQSESVLAVVDDGNEEVPTSTRMAWIREVFPDLRLTSAPDLCGHDTVECTPECSRAYASWLTAHHGSVDAVFAGDSYGETLAAELNAVFVFVNRANVPSEGRRIRADLPGHWDQLSPPSKAWFCRRVVVTGAESTGSTTLAQALATALNTKCVPEYGREFTEVYGLNRAWTSADFDVIAKKQAELEEEAARQSNRILICDTDVLSTAIWHERYLHAVSASVTALASARRPDLYLLTGDDIPFVQDGMRDGERIRGWMNTRFREELEATGVPWLELSGPPEGRLIDAFAFLDEQLGSSWIGRTHPHTLAD
jgi:NadR type nicotinamide-nucleotide adenylyltransferase